MANFSLLSYACDHSRAVHHIGLQLQSHSLTHGCYLFSHAYFLLRFNSDPVISDRRR